MSLAPPIALGLALSALVPRATHGQSASAPTCDAAEHRQFDFWVGEWEVRDPSGQVVGTNSITRSYDGCLLVERWKGASGFEGTSQNFYHPAAASPRNRITWTPNPDGTVRQHWEQSADAGATWATVFDGLYVPRGSDAE